MERREMKFGLTTDSEDLRESMMLDHCFSIFDMDEADFTNIEEIEEHARVILEDVAGLVRGGHIGLYVDKPMTTALVALLKVCKEDNIGVTLFHLIDGKWHEQEWV